MVGKNLTGLHRYFNFTFGSKHLLKGRHSCFCLTHTGKFFVEFIFRIIFWKISLARDLLFKNNLLFSRFQGIHIDLQFQKIVIQMVVLLEADKILFFFTPPPKGVCGTGLCTDASTWFLLTRKCFQQNNSDSVKSWKTKVCLQTLYLPHINHAAENITNIGHDMTTWDTQTLVIFS
jgi:hypothetical protein